MAGDEWVDPDVAYMTKCYVDSEREAKRLHSTPHLCPYCGVNLNICSIDEIKAGICINCYTDHQEYVKLGKKFGQC